MWPINHGGNFLAVQGSNDSMNITKLEKGQEKGKIIEMKEQTTTECPSSCPKNMMDRKKQKSEWTIYL